MAAEGMGSRSVGGASIATSYPILEAGDYRLHYRGSMRSITTSDQSQISSCIPAETGEIRDVPEFAGPIPAILSSMKTTPALRAIDPGAMAANGLGS